jgi:hypothetical protein
VRCVAKVEFALDSGQTCEIREVGDIGLDNKHVSGEGSISVEQLGITLYPNVKITRPNKVNRACRRMTLLKRLDFALSTPETENELTDIISRSEQRNSGICVSWQAVSFV